MKIRILVLAALLIPASADTAFARGTGSYKHLLMVSEGIARPAYSALAGRQNPAGLAFNNGAVLVTDAQSGSTEFTNPGFGADLMFGAPSWGGGVGLDWQSGTGGSATTSYGLSGYMRGLQTAVGLIGRTGLDGGGTSVDLGILIGPYEKVSFGLTAYGITGGIDQLGFGTSVALSHGFSFVTDLITDMGLDRIHLKPGFWVGNQKAGLTVSYGFDASSPDTPGNGGPGDGGISVGAQVLLGRKINWQIHYQQINTLYTGLSFYL